MKRVKIFDKGRIKDLENEINMFLESMEGELIDIKFNSYPYGEDQTDYHSAMVIYSVS